jgi:hypothetical protein
VGAHIDDPPFSIHDLRKARFQYQLSGLFQQANARGDKIITQKNVTARRGRGFLLAVGGIPRIRTLAANGCLGGGGQL